MPAEKVQSNLLSLHREENLYQTCTFRGGGGGGVGHGVEKKQQLFQQQQNLNTQDFLSFNDSAIQSLRII